MVGHLAAPTTLPSLRTSWFLIQSSWFFIASLPFFFSISCPQTFSLFCLVSPSPLSKTKLPTQALYKYNHTLKKNLDNKLVASPHTNLYLFLPWNLGFWPNGPDSGLLRRNQMPKLGTQWDWMPRRVRLELMHAVLSPSISSPLLSLRVRLCLWLHFLLTFKITFMTNYQKFTPKSSLSSLSHREP